MDVIWYSHKDKSPPQGVILLVSGPLGLDLAMNLEFHWYFKKGDDWSASNLEYWSFDPPTQWAEFTPPVEYNLGKRKTTFDNCSQDICSLYTGVDFEFATGEMKVIAGNLKN